MNASNSSGSRSSRRAFLGTVGGAIGASFVAPHLAAADAPRLTLDDPTAQALGYTENAASVDDAKFPAHKPGMQCNNCNFFQGTSSDAFAPCQLYSGKQVNAKGWCSGYAKKA